MAERRVLWLRLVRAHACALACVAYGPLTGRAVQSTDYAATIRRAFQHDGLQGAVDGLPLERRFKLQNVKDVSPSCTLGCPWLVCHLPTQLLRVHPWQCATDASQPAREGARQPCGADSHQAIESRPRPLIPLWQPVQVVRGSGGAQGCVISASQPAQPGLAQAMRPQ